MAHVNGTHNGNGNGVDQPHTNGKSLHLKKASRKLSSPMMPAFMVSAPGKVIVFGEHAVVHGKAAIAAATSLRSYLLVTTLSKSKRTVSLIFPDVDMSHTWDIDQLPWATFSHPSKKKYYYDLVTSLDPDLIAAVQPHLVDISPDKPDAVRKIHRNSALAFLYIFLSLGNQSFPGCSYEPFPGRTPISRKRKPGYRWKGSTGKAVVFQRTDYSKAPEVRPLWDFPELPLLLVNTKQSRSTAQEVAKVGKLKETHPKLVGGILDTIDRITKTAESLIEEDGFESKDMESLRKLGELMTVNHGQLLSLGVSHPRLERIRALVDHEDIGWTKLTGAGGGGCSITLLRPDAPREKLNRLEEQLEEEGYDKFETTLGGDGVGVLFPAVIKNGMDEDEDGGMEIDLDMFLNVEGNEGVEKLVGVHGGVGEREGWKFWRVESH
ncbi:putative mevalonate kinase [Diaporthe ampelina]|uniref:mevalonate kinase n=1 Tax=Diaporthe ampelina TaxID=1214573 RepID=A0A0G2FPP9_9PEZI|nr:putative mevalonate kinase [Diaporthe ampelina]